MISKNKFTRKPVKISRVKTKHRPVGISTYLNKADRCCCPLDVQKQDFALLNDVTDFFIIVRHYCWVRTTFVRCTLNINYLISTTKRNHATLLPRTTEKKHWLNETSQRRSRPRGVLKDARVSSGVSRIAACLQTRDLARDGDNRAEGCSIVSASNIKNSRILPVQKFFCPPSIPKIKTCEFL